ncbi:hypothetical protein [Aerosakkonema funiforme]|nr:hypothetical protein [Aerosakkonema funiforme]
MYGYFISIKASVAPDFVQVVSVFSYGTLRKRPYFDVQQPTEVSFD